MNNLLTLTDLTRNDVQQILEFSTQMRRIVLSDYKKGPQLIGKTVGGVWKKPCTSSTAFQMAANYLSGSCVPVFGAEDVLDASLTLGNMGANAVVAQCDNDHLFRTLTLRCRARVINGGSRQFDPIGVLADLLTLNVKLDGLGNLNVLVVGNRDVNKIKELNHCLPLFGSNLLWYLPADDIATVRHGIVLDKASAAFAGVDAVIDIGLNSYSDAERYYGSSGGITRELMDSARLDCILLGSSTVVDKGIIKEYEHSAAAVRESCYVAVAMAVLYLLQRN